MILSEVRWRKTALIKILSKIITQIFNYAPWVTMILVVGAFKTHLTTVQFRQVLPVVLFLDLIVPSLIYLFLIKTGKITDGSLVRREDRILLFGLSSIFALLATLFSFLFANDLFFKLHLLFFIVGFTTFLITLFYKISGHMIINTSFIFILNFLFGWNLLFAFLIVPLVAFARLYLKAHTLIEILTGVFVGFIEPFLILKIFGLL